MMYLSKGLVQKGSNEQLLYVRHGQQRHELIGLEATVWLNGRYSFAVTRNTKEKLTAEYLACLGLLEFEDQEDKISQYHVTTRCIFCPTMVRRFSIAKSIDARILFWLKHAGIRLTVAELVYLMEHNIEPTKTLLGIEHRQNLIECIYTTDTIADNLLEAQMLSAECRDEVVESLMRLLKKKQLLVL